MTGVARSVSDGLFRHHLEGFQKYPLHRDSRFLEVFNESIVSVDHGRAVLQKFTISMPTLQDIKDTAFNLRDQFEAREPDEKRWEREYGKPDPNWSKNLVGSHAQVKSRVLRQAIRDSVYYTEGPGKFELTQIEDWRQRKADIEFWNRAMSQHCQEHADDMAAFRVELEERGWRELMKEDWASEAIPTPAPDFKRITQADIDRVKQQRDVKAMASGEREDDPDRWE